MNDEQIAFIGLGSNLGHSRLIIFRALEDLQKLSIAPLLKSSLWQTTPVDCPPESPPFVNAVAGLTLPLALAPEVLLENLLAIEKTYGRVPKKISNEPRPLDLDLLAVGSQIRATEKLILPHPRAHCRRFVLLPLSQIAPDYIFPGHTQTVTELLAMTPNDPSIRRVS